MSALAVLPKEGLGMAERSSEVGFTAQDREVLITLKVKMDRLETDVRDGLSRIGKLESDRVGRKDIEDLLSVIEEKTDENSALAARVAAQDVRIAALEDDRPELRSIRKLVYMGIGGLAVLQVVLNFLVKH